jgi:hypothetical protein
VSYPRILESSITLPLECKIPHEIRPLKYKTKKAVFLMFGDTKWEMVPVVTSFSVDLNFSQIHQTI